ncbi:MAG: hypothetical protein JO053_14460 [Acidobacteria bacterium]|nr:hypothetical protein [Acidobacteriota bacterium]
MTVERTGTDPIYASAMREQAEFERAGREERGWRFGTEPVAPEEVRAGLTISRLGRRQWRAEYNGPDRHGRTRFANVVTAFGNSAEQAERVCKRFASERGIPWDASGTFDRRRSELVMRYGAVEGLGQYLAELRTEI